MPVQKEDIRLAWKGRDGTWNNWVHLRLDPSRSDSQSASRDIGSELVEVSQKAMEAGVDLSGLPSGAADAIQLGWLKTQLSKHQVDQAEQAVDQDGDGTVDDENDGEVF